jgi:hypothetical protein
MIRYDNTNSSPGIFGALAGLAGVVMVPPFLGWLYGFYIRKMNPVLLAGTCAGARNSTPAMRAAQGISGSGIPAGRVSSALRADFGNCADPWLSGHGPELSRCSQL